MLFFLAVRADSEARFEIRTASAAASAARLVASAASADAFKDASSAWLATAAAAAQTTANSKEDSFTETTETFTALTGAAGTGVNVTVTQTPKTGFAIDVFFNGVRVKNVTNTAGSKIITLNVPYLTEATDDIVVNYCY